MKVYVIGAGVSKTVGYPLGVELFDEIDGFVRSSGKLFNRFDYHKDWRALKHWLQVHGNPVVAEAYRSRQIEHLFTIFDLAVDLRINRMGSVLGAAKKGAAAVSASEDRWRKLDRASRAYLKYRQILLWALENYLEYRHHYDAETCSSQTWEPLRQFGMKLHSEDVILTFNYDSCLERVLLQQGKWVPQNGYGFELVFSSPDIAATPIPFVDSPVKVLHLHGSVGWYQRPAMREGFRSQRGGAIPREALTPAPLETPIALDPLFLRDLGIRAVDASLPHRPSSESHILLHPSFLKNLESENAILFSSLWQQAAKALRDAEEVTVIGYSLPAADSAALTLLLTNCDEHNVRIVNRDAATNTRLNQLLARKSGRHWLISRPTSFEEWLKHPQQSNP